MTYPWSIGHGSQSARTLRYITLYYITLPWYITCAQCMYCMYYSQTKAQCSVHQFLYIMHLNVASSLVIIEKYSYIMHAPGILYSNLHCGA